MLKKLGYFHLIAVAFSVAILFSQRVDSETMQTDIDIPRLKNLQQDGMNASSKSIPVLIEFSMVGCPFCYEVETEVLKPMLLSGEYENRVIIRKVVIDDDEMVTDFNGSKISNEDLAARYDIDVVPTLVLMDGQGNVVSERMRGVSTIDYYGQYLDRAIEQACSEINQKVKASKRLSLENDTPASAGLPAS